ncbi:GntR family transcriptional regulator [Lactovum odontotermitis]
MMEIDFSSSTPIYQQIRDQVILALADGELSLGEELPSVRSMSDEIGVNMMTVSKSYQLLKDEGIVESDRRRGTKIVDEIVTDVQKEAQIDEALTLLIAESAVRHLSSQKLKDLIDNVFANVKG